ncbi:MAG: pantetheine-phosphate adenylyltransferase [Deltaproteobacteria bacterium]|jgi:pantetheine-phosphate adenylyltransferase|nr:pantetheine-phosphate adenylyltransferase [Deltaproteobacteria bacterium]MBW2533683.1 pantetheine-phosphate adenylyltransferase [Deltaproteobacteria bacterium]
MKEALAVYAGSFDPVTYGHLDLIERTAKLFERVVVAVGVHPTRRPLFSVEERVGLIEQVAGSLPNVEVDSFEGLLVDYCARRGARVIISGLRVSMDFEYELQIAHANADMAPDLDTVFLPTRTNYGFITASMVREIASHRGDVRRYAPEIVCQALQSKFGSGDD